METLNYLITQWINAKDFLEPGVFYIMNLLPVFTALILIGLYWNKESVSLICDKFLGDTIIFLDIDGVLSNRYTYETRISDISSYNLTFRDSTPEFIKDFNDRPLSWGLFANEHMHGEIYDKELCKNLSDTLKQKYPNVKIVLVSSGCIIFTKDSKIPLSYWSETMFDNIPIAGYFIGGGDLKTRYKQCLAWLNDKYIEKNKSFNAYILDDMHTDSLLNKDEIGMVSIKHKYPKVANFEEEMSKVIPLNNNNFKISWKNYQS